jgi:SNF2 family DNA or RNA helicase
LSDLQSYTDQLKPNVIVRGPIFPEPVQVITVIPMGDKIKLIGSGVQTNQTYQSILSLAQLATLGITPEQEPFDGDANHFRLGVEAMRLGLAYEYDPFFSLSIARIDPLPHQLEAVYDYFLKLPRIRFLLADDPGAGKTIMAGLLFKELKIRGLVKRILIVTPANLTFQWQREMKEKFREDFEVVRGELLRATYGSNPWQEKNQVITSISWVSRVEDAKESLLRSRWDLIFVDEAHKMSAYSADKKTLTYKLGEELSDLTDHYVLATATPHKGDAQNFCLFLSLLDKDAYRDVKSLEEAMRRHEAPFYLRRVKEALVTFPDPETGQVKTLFTRRNVQTIEFELNADEWDFYNALSDYVEEQSIKAAQEETAQGRVVGFTMAMLQRRFASSIYAARRSLERMKEKREKILADPEEYRRQQKLKKVPEDFDDLTDEEQQEILDGLENVVASIDPAALREEIIKLGRLIEQARGLEQQAVESKLLKLKEVIDEQGLFDDASMRLLIFTEHKDTLDYLAGEGQDGRPLGKLREWQLKVTQIHGGMKVGDQNTPRTRIYAEREFKEECQVMVATEAAGEGINLQFCWLMINYDIPWNPMRLEQRMGRIHRYKQEKDCLIFNFVSINTREGRVLQKLFERIQQIEADLDPNRTGKVFNVLGDVFPANDLEKMIRKMYARNLTEEVIKNRIVKQVDPERFRKLTESDLEILAKKELNLAAITRKSAEAKEKRLVPEVIADFFVEAAPLTGINLRKMRSDERGGMREAMSNERGTLNPSHHSSLTTHHSDSSLITHHSSLPHHSSFTLEYDAVRKIAQGLGAHLEKLGGVIEVKGDKARLLLVTERAGYLFGGEDFARPAVAKKAKAKKPQLSMFETMGLETEEEQEGGAVSVPEPGATTLDRVHQSMLLFGAGRGDALKQFLVEEGAGQDQRFWRLAQALSALYPRGVTEKRWVDGVLARKKGLGF